MKVSSRYNRKESYRPKTRRRTSATKMSNGEETQRFYLNNSNIKNIQTQYYSSPRGLSNSYDTFSAMGTFKDDRMKEKTEMQALNTRFARYIEDSRYNEALNKKLKEAIERLKNYPIKTAEDIKRMYETELEQIKKLIKDSETEKNLENENIRAFQEDYADLESNLKDCQATEEDNRITLKNQFKDLADCEATISRLEREIELAMEDKERNKNIISRLKNEIEVAKNKLAFELHSRQNSQNRYNDLFNELNKIRERNERELSEIKFIPCEDKINEFRNWWSSEFSNLLNEIQRDYENRLASIKQEADSNYASQIHEIQTSAVRMNMESMQMNDKYSVLRESETKLKNSFTQTKNENLTLTNQNQQLEMKYEELLNEYNTMESEKENEVSAFKKRGEKILNDLNLITQNNEQLKKEIETYDRLLKNGECRNQNRQGINSNSEQNTITYQSRVPTIIRGQVQATENSRVSSKGPILISEVDKDGSYIELENTSQSQSESLSGWKVIQNTDNVDIAELPIDHLTMKPGEKIRVWAEGRGNPNDNDLIWINRQVLGNGEQVNTALLNQRGDEISVRTSRRTYHF